MSVERFDHPGLVFPDDCVSDGDAARKSPARRRRRRQRIVTREVPSDWGMTTTEIGRLLGLSAPLVRQYMHRHEVPFEYIANADGRPLVFWCKSIALDLIDRYPKRHDSIPPGYVSSREAMILLGVANTSVIRLANKHNVPSKRINCIVGGQQRMRRVYERKGILDVRMLRAIGAEDGA